MSEDLKPGSDELFKRKEDFSQEMSHDPEEIIYRTRASITFLFAEILFSAAIALAASYALHEYLNNKRILGTFYSTYSHPLMFKGLIFLPPLVVLLFRAKSLFKKFVTRWDISRRFIREKTFVGIDMVDTADMSKVIDISMTDLIAVANLKVLTKDKTSPVISMNFLPRKQAYEIFSFISSHSINSVPEYLSSKSYRGKKGFDGSPRGSEQERD